MFPFHVAMGTPSVSLRIFYPGLLQKLPLILMNQEVDEIESKMMFFFSRPTLNDTSKLSMFCVGHSFLSEKNLKTTQFLLETKK